MANQDQMVGVALAFTGIVGTLLEFYYLIIQPIADDDIFDQFSSSQYWAMAIPIFLATAGILSIVAWIGITMIRTPPPEIGEFEDFEEEEADEIDEKVVEEEEVEEVIEDIDEDPAEEITEEEPEEEVEDEPDQEPEKVESSTDVDLTDIKGVGASTADDLKAGGFDTIEKIANASVEELTKIKGVGKATAQKYINNAKDLLS